MYSNNRRCASPDGVSVSFTDPCIQVPQRFAQAKSGRLYQSSTDALPIIGTHSIVCQLCNPCSTNVTTYVDSIFCANHSASPVSLKTFYYGCISPDTLQTIPAANTNLYIDCTCSPRACFQCGNHIEICNGTLVATLVVGAYQTYAVSYNGSMILSPDSSIQLQLCSINCSQTALASLSISWWEVPNCEKYIRCCLT
ncbi:hypothetical protein [Anaerosporobacter faecicola]|uniref:hypothetical protein n=1 Tax=Anaerosporobacter faecicola TaxID=2718714 RepID=UPI00143B0044|nr:hypothetical protein [Anaerosporobacter faecicola]